MGAERGRAGPEFSALALTEGQRHELLSLLDFGDDLVRWASVSMPDVERYDRASNAIWALVWWIAGEEAKFTARMAEFRAHGGELVSDAGRRALAEERGGGDAAATGRGEGEGCDGEG